MNELLKQIKYNRTPYPDVVELLNNVCIISDTTDIIYYGIGKRVYFRYYKHSYIMRCCQYKFDHISYNSMERLIEKHTNWYEIYKIDKLGDF